MDEWTLELEINNNCKINVNIKLYGFIIKIHTCVWNIFIYSY